MLQHRQQKNCCCQLPTHTHTYTRLTALCPGLPGWTGTRKVKPISILLKQETVSGSGIHWAVCKSAPRSRQITMPAPHRSVFYRPDALPVAQRTVSKHWRHCQLLNKAENINYLPDIPYIFKKAWRYSIYIVSQKKRPPFYFLNNSVKNQPILMIFGTLNPEKNSDKNLTDLSTSPVRCSHFTSANPKKSHFHQYYSYILLIIYVISEENNP